MFTKKYITSFNYRIPLIERLLTKVRIDSNGCWNFTGGKDSSGYGRIKVGHHNLGAHKVCFLLMVGDYDQEKFELMHSCDNPACINPAHLTPGTHSDNILDAISKGRHTTTKRKQFKNMEPILHQTPRQMSSVMGHKTYEGTPCKIHQRNTTRLTSNGSCVICNMMYNKSKRSDSQKWSRKCALTLKSEVVQSC